MSRADVTRNWDEQLSWYKASRQSRWLHHPVRAFQHRARCLEVEHLRGSGSLRRVQARLFWGEYMTVLLPEEVSSSLYGRGYYEAGMTSFLVRFLKDGMTCVDIGAHYGYFSLLSSCLVGLSGHVYAFEPTPSTFELLQENLHVHPNTTCVQAALYSRAGKLELKDYGQGWSAFNSLVRPRSLRLEGVQCNTVSVDAVALDDYVLSNGITPDFIKIDAESSELDVLAGMTSILENARPILTVEVGDENSATMGSRQIVDFLQTKRYHAYECTDSGLVRHVRQDRYTYGNLIFFHEEKAPEGQ